MISVHIMLRTISLWHIFSYFLSVIYLCPQFIDVLCFVNSSKTIMIVKVLLSDNQTVKIYVGSAVMEANQLANIACQLTSSNPV